MPMPSLTGFTLGLDASGTRARVRMLSRSVTSLTAPEGQGGRMPCPGHSVAFRCRDSDEAASNAWRETTRSSVDMAVPINREGPGVVVRASRVPWSPIEPPVAQRVNQLPSVANSRSHCRGCRCCVGQPVAGPRILAASGGSRRSNEARQETTTSCRRCHLARTMAAWSCAPHPCVHIRTGSCPPTPP